MPERIQLSRAKGWKMPPNTMKVDRSTPWGNPFEVWREPGTGWLVTRTSCHWPVANKNEGQALAVAKFREHMQERLAAEIYPAAVVLRELRGKNLACWCKPGAPCHADVLLELANSTAAPGVPPIDGGQPK